MIKTGNHLIFIVCATGLIVVSVIISVAVIRWAFRNWILYKIILIPYYSNWLVCSFIDKIDLKSLFLFETCNLVECA